MIEHANPKKTILQTARVIAVTLVAALGTACTPEARAPNAAIGTPEAALKDATSPGEDAPVHAERLRLDSDNAHRIAPVVERAFVESPRRGAVRAVVLDERTGELVVIGTEAGINKVRAFLSPGLVADDARDELEVVPLAHAEAGAVASIAGRVLDVAVRMEPDTASNAVVIAGRPDARERAKKAILALDVPSNKAARAQ